MRIGIIVAMDKELVQLRALLEHETAEVAGNMEFILGSIGKNDIVLQKCGIGKVNAAIGTVEMITRYQPDAVISSGCAGGASAKMNVGDVIVGTEMTYHDVYCGTEVAYGQVFGMPARYQADSTLLQKALSIHFDTPVYGGLIASGDWFVNSKGKIGDILDHFPEAKAVDMESCAIAQACAVYQVPFISFRIISDVPLRDTQASQYYDFWERLADGSFHVIRQFLSSL